MGTQNRAQAPLLCSFKISNSNILKNSEKNT
jgi:hypothetical protein